MHDAEWAAPSVVVGVLGFLVAAALWWNYFDVGAASSAEELQEATTTDSDDRQDDERDERHDLFIYGHLPLTLGIASPASDWKSSCSTRRAASFGRRWILAAGVALFFLGAAIIVAGADRRWRTAFPWPAVAIPLVLAPAFVPALSAATTVAAVGAIALTMAVSGTRARRAWTTQRSRAEDLSARGSTVAAHVHSPAARAPACVTA